MTVTPSEPSARRPGRRRDHAGSVFSDQNHQARLVVVFTALAAALLLGACGANQDRPGGANNSTGKRTVTVFAASSLSDAFVDLEASFETSHPQSDVRLNLAGSSALREQILAGAPADVFASANQSTMEVVVASEPTRGQPKTFARNSLTIAVPSTNPGGITGIESLARDELLIGLCSDGVPCGDFARSSLMAAGIEPSIDTNEPDVRALLTKIEAGELDAGIVYQTDVLAADGRVDAITIPPEFNQDVVYPVVQLTAGGNQGDADAFIAFLLSKEGQAILVDHGFGPIP